MHLRLLKMGVQCLPYSLSNILTLTKIQFVHPFTFYLNSNLTSNRAEECNTHSTPDCHHGGHNLPSKPLPELLIPHTPFISCLTDPNSPESLFFSPCRQICRQTELFGCQTEFFFRRHSVGKGYNNDCVLEGEAFSGKRSI